MKNLKVTMAALLAGAFAFSPFAANALVTAQDVQNSDKSEGLTVRSLEEAEQLAQQINEAQGGSGGDSILAQYRMCYLKKVYVVDPGDPEAGDDYNDSSEMKGQPDSPDGMDHEEAYSIGVNGQVIGYFVKGAASSITIEHQYFRLYVHEVGTRREKILIEIGNGNPDVDGDFHPIGKSVIVDNEVNPGEGISLDMNEFFDPDEDFPEEGFGLNAVRITDLNDDTNDEDDEPGDDGIAYGADIDAVGVDCEGFDEKAITLKSLETSAEDGKNVVKFETAREKDSMGMKVFRINVKDIEEVGAVSPQGSPTSGSEYVVEDTKVKSGDTYIYLLQELDASGAITVYPENANEIEPVTAK